MIYLCLLHGILVFGSIIPNPLITLSPPSTSSPNPIFYNKILPISNILEVLTSEKNSFQVPNNWYSTSFVIISPTTHPGCPKGN
jgi:hypothetical protein